MSNRRRLNKINSFLFRSRASGENSPEDGGSNSSSANDENHQKNNNTSGGGGGGGGNTDNQFENENDSEIDLTTPTPTNPPISPGFERLVGARDGLLGFTDKENKRQTLEKKAVEKLLVYPPEDFAVSETLPSSIELNRFWF